MTKINPVIGSLKQTKMSKDILHIENTSVLKQNILNKWEDLQNAFDNWKKSARNIQHKSYVTKSTIKLSRSETTQKILLSETRNQDRSAHQTFAAAESKAHLIKMFHAYETAILSIPALGHNTLTLTVESGHVDGAPRIFINSFPIIKWNAKIDESHTNSLLWIIDKLEGIKVNENSPQWIVNNTLITADTKDEAVILYQVLKKAPLDPKDREKQLKKIPKRFFVGLLENDECIRTAFKEKNLTSVP
jgi:hypothetical protein